MLLTSILDYLMFKFKKDMAVFFERIGKRKKSLKFTPKFNANKEEKVVSVNAYSLNYLSELLPKNFLSPFQKNRTVLELFHKFTPINLRLIYM